METSTQIPNTHSEDMYIEANEYIRAELARLDVWLCAVEESNGDASAKLRESEEQLDELVQRLAQKNFEPPLRRIQRVFGLNRQFADLLLCGLAPSLDAKYLAAFAAYSLNGKPDVTPFSLAKILQSEGREWSSFCFGPNALFEYDLLYRDPAPEYSSSALSRPIRVHERLVSYVRGEAYLPIEVLEFLSVPEKAEESAAPIKRSESTKSAVSNLSRLLDGREEKTIVHLLGPDGTGKSQAALAVCEKIGLPLLALDIRRILARPELTDTILRRVLRETILFESAILISDWHLLKEQSLVNAHFLLTKLQAVCPVLILTSEKPFFLSRKGFPIVDVQFESSDHATRLNSWDVYINGSSSGENAPDLQAIAGLYRFNDGQIRSIVERARLRSLAFKGNEAITGDELIAGCQEESSQNLAELSVKVQTRHSWDFLILPEAEKTQLREICDHMKFRAQVYEDWGYQSRVSAAGLNALFTGPPGTGKTLAASVIARELGLDLYKIDLSTVISKYIGETEKNLSKIFKEAEASNAILFFDEADSLFGKRSAVNDAHDRYANIQVGYLLQKMEEFPGMTILASNLIENIDDAFMRRLHFSVDFPLPAAEEREKIWQISFPEKAPLGDEIDFEKLASKLKVPGGNIRNIALHAAFHAAAEKSSITMEHIARAAKREYEKEGRSLNA